MMQAHAAYQRLGEAEIVIDERNQLILDELPQVHFIASRMLERLPASVQLEDLVHAGVLGLLEAFDNYDSSRNAQFKTFARFRIRGAILDSLRTLDWGSRGMRRKAREIVDAQTRLQSRFGRTPEKEEVAAEMGLSLEQLETAMMEIDSLQIVSQQATIASETGEVRDLIESAASADENPFELCMKGQQREHLASAIASLNEREQLILSLYYREELTMKEVAEVVGIALSRVSQIHQAAINKLRTRLTTPEPRPLPGILRAMAASADAPAIAANAVRRPLAVGVQSAMSVVVRSGRGSAQ